MNAQSNMPIVTTTAMIERLRIILDMPSIWEDSHLGHRPPFIWGAPGIGKSEVVRQAADGRTIIERRLATETAVDSKGVPFADMEAMVSRWLADGTLPDASRHGENGVLFVDEFAQGMPSVQNAYSEVLTDGRIGGYEFPKSWHIVGASNRTQDKANSHKMGSHLMNRFAHYEMIVDPASWAAWAGDEDIDPVLINFVTRVKPELLEDRDPKQPIHSTPRTVASLHAIISRDLPPDVEQDMIASYVGMGFATEFQAYAEAFRYLPTMTEVLDDPMTAMMVEQERPDHGLVMCTILARHGAANPEDFDTIVQYLDRMQPEIAAACIQEAMTRSIKLIKDDPKHVSVADTKGYVDWTTKNFDQLT